MTVVLARLLDVPTRDYTDRRETHSAFSFVSSTMPLQAPNKFSSVQISTSHSHARQASVASFASSLYFPVDPDNKPNFDDENEAYPSSDELFGPDHEEGDDYTISSRRYLSSHSRYSSSFTNTSHPPTPPRSTISLQRSSSSLSLTPPQARYGNPDPGSSPLAPVNRLVASATTSVRTALPSPPSTARSTNENHLASLMNEVAAPKPDEGVPIEKFDQLVIEHLEQDRALLQTLRRLEDQKARIAQLTYALSRLRVLSNSACLYPPSESGHTATPRSSPPMQFHRLGGILPKPLIVKPSTQSASSSTLSRSTLTTRENSSGLTVPSLNEAINQRRRAKQQLHEFALRRPTRNAKSRPIGRFTAGANTSATQAKRVGWEGARGSPSMVSRETKPRAPGIVDHPNITMRRGKRPDTSRQPNQSVQTWPPTAAMTPSTPPRLTSLFSSPSTMMSRSPLTPTQGQILSAAIYESPTTPVPSRKNKPLPPRPVSPTMPMKLARNVSYNYTLPPVPPPHETTAHITLIDGADTTPTLPADEVQNRLAATFAHFTKARAPSPSPRPPSPPRRALDMTSPEYAQPDYLEQLLRKKWVEQLDEHAHQARGSWKSPLRSIKQRIAGGLGLARRPSRASIGESSSDAHTHPNVSMDGNGGYVHGLDTLEEGTSGWDRGGGFDVGKPPPVVDHKQKKLKKKGSLMDDGAHPPPSATPSTSSGAVPSAKPSKSTWRFSRIGQSQT
ncbi:hypothetical protein FRC12_018865 [Ceratobasidium sp. 428]|nr:hypothetical protein FRC12_018865 [Ceratobasidium sp. 428]